MCDFCRADENYFHMAECVYDQLVKEYPRNVAAGFNPDRGLLPLSRTAVAGGDGPGDAERFPCEGMAAAYLVQ